MSLKLYFDLLSQPSRTVYIFLKANKIPFEAIPVALRKREQFQTDYAKINRFRKVPAIEDGTFKLAESIAICRYLVKEKNVADFWYPKDSKRQAKVDEYLEWQHNNTRQHCSRYFVVKWRNPLVTGKIDHKKIKEVEKNLEECLDTIEELWLSKPYIAGDNLSLADLVAACEIEQPRLGGYDPTVGRPKLDSWLTRIREGLSPFYQEAHQIINKIATASK